MKYIGNKTRLIDFIENCMIDSNIDYKNVVVYDLFSGTGSVSEFFKKNNCDVYSCDNMNYAIVEQYRKLYFNEEPSFKELYEELNTEKLDDVLYYLNNLPLKKGYYFDNFCEEGKYNRKFFKMENAEKIDSIRDKIESWKEKLPSEKYNFLVGLLMDSADHVSNTAGTYGAYLKIWRSMALKDLELKKPDFINTGKVSLEVRDVLEFIKNKPKANIVYLDPPYNARQYPAYFSALESIVVNDKQQLNGKTGLRNYEQQKSKFSIKTDVNNTFQELIDNIKADYIVMSYSTEGIMKKDFIFETLSKKGETTVYDKNYRRFKTNAWTSDETNLKELVFICKVKQ